MRYSVSPQDKAFLYRLFTRLINEIACSKIGKLQLKKIVLKFTPGDDSLHLRDGEHHLVLSWLYRIADMAEVREKKDMLFKLNRVISALTEKK